jgi:RHS repeat-associated protein
MTDASGSTTYTYDTRNRLLTKATPEGTLTYTYDASGNVASIDSSNANGTSVSYGWDAANQLQTVTDNRFGGITTATYTPTGRPLTVSEPNGVGVTYAYDSLDRVTSMVWKKGTNPAFASWAYGYNQRGQKTSSTDVSGRETAYTYDMASRLTGETITDDPSGPRGNGELTYVIDPVGNRSSRASTLAALGAQSLSYDPNDELTSDGYDLNGNTTSSGGHAYAYDFENRFVSKDSGAVTLVYDGDGHRVAKTAAGVTTQYLVDDLNPTGYLQVMDETSGGMVQVRYTYGNMLISQARNQDGTFSPSFYGYDAHRNVTIVTDSLGSVTVAYTYDAWGNLIGSSGATPNDRFYCGEEFDRDIGALILRARHLDLTKGRFTTIDALAGFPRRPISLNHYLYADEDPVDVDDPLGLAGDLAFEANSLSADVKLLDRGSIAILAGVQYGAEQASYYQGGNELLDTVGKTAAFYKDAAVAAEALTGGAIGTGLLGLSLTNLCIYSLAAGQPSAACVPNNPIPPIFGL